MLVIQWSSFFAGFEKSVGNRTFLNMALSENSQMKFGSGNLTPDLNKDNKYYSKYIMVWRSHRMIRALLSMQEEPAQKGIYPHGTIPGDVPDNSNTSISCQDPSESHKSLHLPYSRHEVYGTAYPAFP
jgi:hypothetical protein